MRRERDNLRLEKNEQFVENCREIEELKNKARDLQSDKERLEMKSQQFKEEYQQMQLTNERKQSEVHQVISEKAQLDNMLKSKD